MGQFKSQTNFLSNAISLGKISIPVLFENLCKGNDRGNDHSNCQGWCLAIFQPFNCMKRKNDLFGLSFEMVKYRRLTPV